MFRLHLIRGCSPSGATLPVRRLADLETRAVGGATT
jgi:hypothetical protein